MADSRANISERPQTRSITRMRQIQQQQQQQQQQQLQQPKQVEEKQRSKQKQEKSLPARSSGSSHAKDDHVINTSAPEKQGIDEISSPPSKATNPGNGTEYHLDPLDDASNLVNQNFNDNILSAKKHTYNTSGLQDTPERGLGNNAYSCDCGYLVSESSSKDSNKMSLSTFSVISDENSYDTLVISNDAIIHSSSTKAETTALPDDYSQSADMDDKTSAARDDISAEQDNKEKTESTQKALIIDQRTYITDQQTKITDQLKKIINQPTDDIMTLPMSYSTSKQSQLGLDSFDTIRSIDLLLKASAESVPLTDASSCTRILGQASSQSISQLQHQQQLGKMEGEEQQQQQQEPQLQQAEQQQQQQQQQLKFQTHLKGILKQETNSTATLSSFATTSTSGESQQKPLTKSTLRKKLTCINSELDDNPDSLTVGNRRVICTEGGHLVSDLHRDDVEVNSRRTPISFVRLDDNSKKISITDQADDQPLRKLDEPPSKALNFDNEINKDSSDSEDSDDDSDDASGENRSALRNETTSEGIHNQFVINDASTAAQINAMEGDEENGNEDGNFFITNENTKNRDTTTLSREAVLNRKSRGADEGSSDEPASKKARHVLPNLQDLSVSEGTESCNVRRINLPYDVFGEWLFELEDDKEDLISDICDSDNDSTSEEEEEEEEAAEATTSQVPSGKKSK